MEKQINDELERRLGNAKRCAQNGSAHDVFFAVSIAIEYAINNFPYRDFRDISAELHEIGHIVDKRGEMEIRDAMSDRIGMYESHMHYLKTGQK
ncbi:MAG: hypothetical protein QME12_08210, partial [Nanoarchaeota archaeon]|nr:hypothetical protein [Nanoarchaeota archaeon]